MLDISTMSPFVMLMPSRMGGDSSNTSILWVLELPPQMEMVKHLHRKRDQNSTLNYKKVKYSYLKILKKEMPSRAHHQHIHQGHIWATHVAVQPQPSQEAAPLPPLLLPPCKVPHKARNCSRMKDLEIPQYHFTLPGLHLPLPTTTAPTEPITAAPWPIKTCPSNLFTH